MAWEFPSNNHYDGFDLNELTVDQAYLNITSGIDQPIWMYTLSEECVKCPYTYFRRIAGNGHVEIKVRTIRNVMWKLFTEDYGQYTIGNQTSLCTIDPNLGQFGIYNLNIEPSKCNFSVVKEPVNIYFSLLYIFLIWLCIGLGIKYAPKLWKMFNDRRLNTSFSRSATQSPTNEQKPQIKPRIKSLDTFRGIAIVLMIFVNTGGGHYWWMEHATWNGLHVADLVFPWFLWIMGVCIPISIKSQLTRSIPKQTVIWNIFKRSVKLFLLGLFLNTIGNTRFDTLRIMGVLQRFGIAYFVVGSVHTIFWKPFLVVPLGKIKRAMYDVYILSIEWAIMLIITIVHLAIIFGMPVPDCPSGYLGPGGKYDNNANPNCIGGATGFIDRQILGDEHIYQYPTARSTYDSKPFDPEGLFGCLTTIVHTFLGVQCGITLIVHTGWWPRIKRWLCWSIVSGVVGGCLALFSQETGPIPINKNLWSISYVLVTVSLAYLLFLCLYYVVDVKMYWAGEPFIYAGMNAILLYCGHMIFHMMPWRWSIGPMNTHFMLLFECIWNTAVWVGISYYLYCNNIFYSI